MIDLYVYYRVRSDIADSMLPHVRAMQKELQALHGVEGKLKRRPEEQEGLQTWMEVYESVPEEFLFALEQAAIHAYLPIDGRRHVEIFVGLPECA